MTAARRSSAAVMARGTSVFRLAAVMVLVGAHRAPSAWAVPMFAPPPFEKEGMLGMLGTCPDGTMEHTFYENDFNDVFKQEYEERSHPNNVLVTKGALSVNGSDGTDSVLWRVNVPHEAVGPNVQAFCIGTKKKANWGKVGFEFSLADADGQLLSVGYSARHPFPAKGIPQPPQLPSPAELTNNDKNVCWREHAGQSFLLKSGGNCSSRDLSCCKSFSAGSSTPPAGRWLQDVLCYAPYTGKAWLKRQASDEAAAETIHTETRSSARRGLHLRLQWKEGRGTAAMWGRQHLLVDNLQVHICVQKKDFRQIFGLPPRLPTSSNPGAPSVSVSFSLPLWPLWHTHLGQVITPGVLALIPMIAVILALLFFIRQSPSFQSRFGAHEGELPLYKHLATSSCSSASGSDETKTPDTAKGAATSREQASTLPEQRGGHFLGAINVKVDVTNPLLLDDSGRVQTTTAATSPMPSTEHTCLHVQATSAPPKIRAKARDLSEEISLQLAEEEDEESWRIYNMLEEVELKGKLDEGEFGVVYRGRWKGAEVAVKIIKPRNVPLLGGKGGAKPRAPKFNFPFEIEPELEDAHSLDGSSGHSSMDSSHSGGTDKAISGIAETFAREVSVLRRLRSNRIVMFMGACLGPQDLCLVTEYMPRGSLYDLLHRRKKRVVGRRLLTMAHDIAEGCAFLHAQRIVHRDLKSSNLLLDESYRVKVADFGLSRIRAHSAEALPTNGWAGTAAYMAPEVLKGLVGAYTERADCYSFGVVLWEMVMREVPWRDLEPYEIIGRVAYSTDGLSMPEAGACPDAFAQLMQDCLHKEPVVRPLFTEVLCRLDTMISEADALAEAAAGKL